MNLTESESNNLRNVADTMNVGDTMTGKLSTAADVDCFRVVFGQKAWVTFELDIPAGTDYRIRVYTNDNSGENYATQDIRLNYLGQMRKCSTVVSSTSDIYYICISVNTSGNYNANANYTLRVLYSNNTVQTYITNSINTLGITNAYNTSNSNNKYWNKGSLSASDWGLTSSTIGTPNTFGNAYQCAGFSFYLAYLIFNQSIDRME
jgi:hypothetical protein